MSDDLEQLHYSLLINYWIMQLVVFLSLFGQLRNSAKSVNPHWCRATPSISEYQLLLSNVLFFCSCFPLPNFLSVVFIPFSGLATSSPLYPKSRDLRRQGNIYQKTLFFIQYINTLTCDLWLHVHPRKLVESNIGHFKGEMKMATHFRGAWRDLCPNRRLWVDHKGKPAVFKEVHL